MAEPGLKERLQARRKAFPDFLRRQSKHVKQLRYGWGHAQQLSFVFGCQRSGTKMLMRILDNSPAIHIYHENNELAFSDFQLRADPILRALMWASPAPSQIFKPICDSHLADQLLSRFPDAHGLWIYRHYDDVANSALQKWGEHQREVVTAVAMGDLKSWGWRTDRLTDRIIADIRRVYRTDLRVDEGALLFWYMRNAFFFELGLERHPRMLLMKYEALVQDPKQNFPRVFAHMGAPFEEAFIARVHADSVGRKAPPQASPEIRALCEDLLQRLDAHTQQPQPQPWVSPVLVMSNNLGVGGAERYAATVANWMVQQGVSVGIAGAPGALRETLKPEVRYHPLPLEDVRFGLPVASLRLRRILHQQRPAMIVANSLVATWIARAAQGNRRIPIVTVAHGWPEDRYRWVGKLMRVSDRVIAVSPDVKEKLVAGGLPAERCHVILNGVDCSQLGRRQGPVRDAVRAALGAGPEQVLVVSLGRLMPQKAQHHIIAIAERLRDRHPELRYAIIGQGDRAEELQAMVRAAGLENVVCLPGARKDVPDILGAADIYLSTSDWEGMPLSTIEAMASALPVVATQTEGSGQLLTEDCGFVVPVGDVEALSRAVAGLAADASRRQQMALAAQKRAVTAFGHDRMVRELAEQMQQLKAAQAR